MHLHIYIHYQSKLLCHPQKILFLIIEELFLMKQVKHQIFIYLLLCQYNQCQRLTGDIKLNTKINYGDNLFKVIILFLIR